MALKRLKREKLILLYQFCFASYLVLVVKLHRFLSVLPLPHLVSSMCPFSFPLFSYQERQLFFLIAILIIINQVTAGHEAGPLSVLSFPFCILYSLVLSRPATLHHRLLSLSLHTFSVICLLHCLCLFKLSPSLSFSPPSYLLTRPRSPLPHLSLMQIDFLFV